MSSMFLQKKLSPSPLRLAKEFENHDGEILHLQDLFKLLQNIHCIINVPYL